MSDIYKEMVWSHSRLSTFKNCPYEFYLHYILGDDDLYPSEDNYYAQVGSLAHNTLEKIFKKELSIEAACEYFAEKYESEITAEVQPKIMDSTYDKIITFFTESDFDWIDDYEILGVEKEVHFTINDYKFVGFIDLLLRDKRDGRLVIVDHKSMSNPFGKKGQIKKSAASKFAVYRSQSYLYAYAIYLEYGEYPKELVWYLFKENGKLVSIKFDKDEYEEVISNIPFTINLIEKEIDFEAKTDYFYCHNLCNYRNSCEYKSDKDEEGW